MRLVDMIPFALFALKTNGATSQTTLTHFVAGESGRGSPKLTKILFPEMMAKGLITSTRIGRSTMFSITAKGREFYMQQALDLKDEAWMADFMKEVIAAGG